MEKNESPWLRPLNQLVEKLSHDPRAWDCDSPWLLLEIFQAVSYYCTNFRDNEPQKWTTAESLTDNCLAEAIQSGYSLKGKRYPIIRHVPDEPWALIKDQIEPADEDGFLCNLHVVSSPEPNIRRLIPKSKRKASSSSSSSYDKRKYYKTKGGDRQSLSRHNVHPAAKSTMSW